MATGTSKCIMGFKTHRSSVTDHTFFPFMSVGEPQKTLVVHSRILLSLSTADYFELFRVIKLKVVAADLAGTFIEEGPELFDLLLAVGLSMFEEKLIQGKTGNVLSISSTCDLIPGCDLARLVLLTINSALALTSISGASAYILFAVGFPLFAAECQYQLNVSIFR